ncbi:MAG: heme-binding protein [Burkholderiaceae bacterium]
MHRFLLAFTLAAMPLLSHAIEEPAYEIIRKFDNVELRQYAPYVVAEVVLDAAAEDAGSQAFPILAGYIFGKNKGEKKLAMTAPVTQTAAPMRMDMTAPVTQAAMGGRTQVQFVLPKGVTLATAPEPIDPRVQLRAMPAATWAVIRYSGTWSQGNDGEHLARLKASLEAHGVATRGEPVLARYNSPFTPWFMRRNEIWLALP